MGHQQPVAVRMTAMPAQIPVDLPPRGYFQDPRKTRHGRAPTWPPGRRCSYPDCITVLTIYDDGGSSVDHRCFVHQAPKYRTPQ